MARQKHKAVMHNTRGMFAKQVVSRICMRMPDSVSRLLSYRRKTMSAIADPPLIKFQITQRASLQIFTLLKFRALLRGRNRPRGKYHRLNWR